MKAQNVSIIGLGRLGASIGLAVKKSSATMTVIGHDRNQDVAKIAQSPVGAVDKVEANARNLASRADILVLAVPMSELEPLLSVIGDAIQPHALILDFSSLKQPGLKWAAKYLVQGHYVGASPVLAADWLTDGRVEVEAASADLFKNSIFCLMPSPKADPQAVETAVNFGSLIGAVPYFVDPMEYDSLLQGLEVVPGLLGAAMFRAITQSTGWRDMLRFAGLPFAQTTQPLSAGADIAYQAMSNKIATLRWLDALVEEMKSLRRLVSDGEEEMLASIFTELHMERERWLAERAQNQWSEAKEPDIEGNTISGQLLGAFGRKRKPADKS
ncbi:MAG: prephenate dehydrogenase [Chloroflexi bacterium]|nr:prephenate dehydrogenase [Chloroflexota bacterium]MBK6710377.1 prephenate dehydrogenase [Chloroflexota bacterium]MBP7592029.1 prephenate dehydrogenase [Chloroflexota bacterium]